MVHSTNKCLVLFAAAIAATTNTNIISDTMRSSSLLVEAFLPVTTLQSIKGSQFASTSNIPWLRVRPSSKLSLQKGWLGNGEEDDDDDDGLVTREDLNRDLLGMEPKVKRKRKNGKGQGYRPLDNRDHLPFSVRTKTPDDPYKNEFQKQKEQQSIKNNNGATKKTTDLDRHMLASPKRNTVTNKNKIKKNNKNTEASTTPSRLIQRRSKKKNKDDDDNSVMTMLGEFELDKSTTSGDVIVLGDKEYLVERSRFQHKYAGGQRFVMVRKILEVKEVTRVQNEEALLRQYESSPSSLSSTALPGDLE